MSFFQDVRTQKITPSDNSEVAKFLKQNADGGAEVHIDGGTVAITSADGSIVTIGANADVAVTGDTAGTLSAKLRGFLKIFTDIWDSVNHRIRVDGSGVTQPVSGTVTGNLGSASISVDSNNTTATPLAASASFVGTATNILAYSQLNIEIFATPVAAKASFYFEFSKDGVAWDVSVPALIRDPTFVIPIPVINVHNFFRVRYLNDGGVAAIASLGLPDVAGTPTLQTAFRLTTYLLPGPTKELTRTLDQTIQGSDAVNLSRSVAMGKQPGGVYVNTPAGGRDSGNSSTTTLGANAVFTGAWVDTQGFLSIVVTVNADQASAVGGVTVQYSDTATGVVVRATDSRDYVTADIGLGIVYRFSPRARYYRIVYTNGTVAQTTFFLNALLNIVPADLPLKPIVSSLSDTQDSVVGKTIVVGKVGGAYSNVVLGTANGLQVDVNQFEAAAPIKALTLVQVKQVTIGTAASQIDASPLTHRKSIEVRALNANGNNKIYVGFNNAVATGSGRELVANEPVTLEVDETVQIWAVGSAAGLNASVLEIGGTP